MVAPPSRSPWPAGGLRSWARPPQILEGIRRLEPGNDASPGWYHSSQIVSCESMWVLLSVLFVSDFIVSLKLLGVLWDFILGSVSSPSISDFMILHHFKITFHPTCLDIMNWLLTKACTAFTSESPSLASPSCQFPISRRGRSRAMPLQEEEMLRPRWCKMLPVKVAPDGQVLTVWNLDPLHPGCCTFEGWKKIKHFESTSPLSPLLG